MYPVWSHRTGKLYVHLVFHVPFACYFYTAYENSKIATHSHPDAFPSSLRQLRKTTTKVHEGSDALLKVTIVTLFGEMLWTFYVGQVTETCPECGHMEAYSKEIQVRVCDHSYTLPDSIRIC
jgi:DNA-directed RNA polymerase I subunit RPA12